MSLTYYPQNYGVTPTSPYTPAGPSQAPIGPGLGYNNDYYRAPAAPAQQPTAPAPQQNSAPSQPTDNRASNLVNDYQNQQRNSINNQYDTYKSYLDTQLSALPTLQANLTGQVDTLYGGQKSSIDTATQGGMTDLKTSENKANERKVQSFNDLAQNYRDALFASNQVLGQRGASNSSAAPMYQYALAKQQGKEQANVTRDTNSTLADIDARREKLNQVANDQINQLNTWKNSETLKVTQYVNDKKAQLQQQVASGQMDRETALRELNTQTFQLAYQRLQQIDQEAKGMQDALTQWGMNQISQLNAYKAQAGQLSTVNIPAYVAQQYSYLPQMVQQSQQAMVGMAPQQKKNDQVIF